MFTGEGRGRALSRIRVPACADTRGLPRILRQAVGEPVQKFIEKRINLVGTLLLMVTPFLARVSYNEGEGKEG